eukprot:TRINITY_DN13526_c0_g1_i1.p1 TRINITY_DN13526_c0_g1~~TRINITY_DN13526_c0_g1_i1.p1  ORF type:complete len:430 (+),score=184.06 TRINITY_DN13526_c0_g1_i1:68-1291(+)
MERPTALPRTQLGQTGDRRGPQKRGGGGQQKLLADKDRETQWLPRKLRSVAEKARAAKIMQMVGMWDDREGRYYTRERQQQETMKYFYDERLVLKYSPRGAYAEQQRTDPDNKRIPSPRGLAKQGQGPGRKSALTSASFDPSTIAEDMTVGIHTCKQLQDMRRTNPLLKQSPVLDFARGLNGERLEKDFFAGRSDGAAQKPRRLPLGALSTPAGLQPQQGDPAAGWQSVQSQPSGEPSPAALAQQVCPDGGAEGEVPASATGDEAAGSAAEAARELRSARGGDSAARSMPPLPKIAKDEKSGLYSSGEYSSLMMQLRKTRKAVEEHGRSINTVKSLLEMQGTAELKKTITRIFADPKQAAAISEAEWAKRHKQYEAERQRLQEQQQEELRDQREELEELAGRVQRIA